MPDLLPLRYYLQVEGLVTLAVPTAVYARESFSWGLYAALFFAPDLFMLGYGINQRVGAFCYNIAHTKTSPALLLAVSYFSSSSTLLAIALIWWAHIGFDRMFGFGLKHDSGFKSTHLDNL